MDCLLSKSFSAVATSYHYDVARTPFITTARRTSLHTYLRKRSLPASVAMRIRIVLMLDEGASYHMFQEKLDTTAPTISLWKRRYRQDGIVGLATFHPGQPAKKLTTEMRARILAKTQQPPPDGLTALVAAQKWRR